MPVNNFTVIESDYGKFVVNRHCAFQADHLIKTGRPHIQPELNNILALVTHLPENCVIVDAGANIGLVAVPNAQAVLPRKGVVHAFEVQRMMHYALCGSAALNDLENLFANNKALGATPGVLRAARPNYAQSQDFGLFSLTQQDEALPERIEVVTIDSLHLPGLDFLKIDVEGMEIAVLKGAQESLERYRPCCWVEYWKVGIPEIKAAFDGLGYRFYRMDPLNLLCLPIDKLPHLKVDAPLL
jgi:FkbM family methyltransferase